MPNVEFEDEDVAMADEVVHIIPPEDNPVTVVVWIQGIDKESGKVLAHLDWWPHVSSNVGRLGWKDDGPTVSTAVSHFDERFYAHFTDFLLEYLKSFEEFSALDDRNGEIVPFVVKKIEVLNSHVLNSDMDTISVSFERSLKVRNIKALQEIQVSLVDSVDEGWVKDMILLDIEGQPEGGRIAELCELSLASTASGSFDSMDAY